jgi:hypothetical protein
MQNNLAISHLRSRQYVNLVRLQKPADEVLRMGWAINVHVLAQLLLAYPCD